MRICVYGAASPTIDEEYKIIVEKMGKIGGVLGLKMGCF